MRVRTTILLALVLLVLGLLYYASEAKRQRDAGRGEAERKVLAFQPDDVEELTVEKAGERVIARRAGESWVLVAPVRTAGDARAIEGLLAYVARLRKERTIDNPGRLAEFGLEPPGIKFTLKPRKGAPVTLLLGDQSPMGEFVFARLEGDASVFLAPAALRSELSRSPYTRELRDKSLVAFDEAKVDEVLIERRDTTIRLRKVSGEGWQIHSPFQAPADPSVVEDLLWKLRHNTLSEFVDEEAPDLRRYGLNRPDIRVLLTEDGGRERWTVLLKRAGAGRLAAWTEPRRTVGYLNDQLLSDFSLEPSRLEDRRLLRFEADALTSITLKRGETVIELRRRGEAWHITAPTSAEADGLALQNIVSALAFVRFREVVSEQARDGARYGLVPPEREIVLRKHDGTAIATVRVGRREGDRRYAALGGGPRIYAVPADAFDKVAADVEGLRKKGPGEIMNELYGPGGGRK